MRGFLLLCDFAEENGGKLNVIGGGFTRVWHGRPLDFSIAGKLWIPWHQTNSPLDLEIALVDEDGRLVTQGPENTEVRVTAKVEVGRPPGIAHGSELDLPLVFRFRDLNLQPSRYTWRLLVDGQEVDTYVFTVEARATT